MDDLSWMVPVSLTVTYIVYWHIRLRIALRTLDRLHSCMHIVAQAAYVQQMSTLTSGSVTEIDVADLALISSMLLRIVNLSPRGECGIFAAYDHYRRVGALLAVIDEEYSWASATE